MADLEKQAKLKALKSLNSKAKDSMSKKLNECKDTDALKKHVKEMSEETDIDFKNDADKIQDPQHYGNVVGRHITDEDDCCDDDDLSVYDIDDKLERLMAKKAAAKKAAGIRE